MWLKYAVSVFRRFSTRYFGICHFFLRYCGIGYPPMSPSNRHWRNLKFWAKFMGLPHKKSKMAIRENRFVTYIHIYVSKRPFRSKTSPNIISRVSRPILPKAIYIRRNFNFFGRHAALYKASQYWLWKQQTWKYDNDSIPKTMKLRVMENQWN